MTTTLPGSSAKRRPQTQNEGRYEIGKRRDRVDEWLKVVESLPAFLYGHQAPRTPTNAYTGREARIASGKKTRLYSSRTPSYPAAATASQRAR